MKWRRTYCLWFIATVLMAPKTGIAATCATHWVGTWAASVTPLQPPLSTIIPTSYSDVTFRDIVHISVGGSQLRLILSNEFGPEPLHIGGVHIALSASDGEITAAGDHPVSFGGGDTVTIPPGAIAVSDSILFNVPAFSDLAVSIYIPAKETADHLSYHAYASSTNYIAEANALSSTSLNGAREISSWILLKEIDVEAKGAASAVVTLGDSITDGVHSTLNKNARWPDVLAERLHTRKKTAAVSVLNGGISGNRLVSLGNPLVGQDALARFDRDVLGASGVKYVIVLDGINDVGRAGKPQKPEDVTNTETLIWALTQLASRAHAHGLKIFAATLTPYRGAIYFTDQGEKMRQAINAFIRTSSDFDGVIDSDKAIRDPEHPDRFNAAYDSGDHLHPNDAGYKAIGDAISLAMFK